MTPEEKSLLERTYKLAEDNNSILRKMRRASRITMVLHALYWVVILTVSFGAYYFIQPYVSMLLGGFDEGGILSNIQGNVDQAQGAAETLRDLLK